MNYTPQLAVVCDVPCVDEEAEIRSSITQEVIKEFYGRIDASIDYVDTLLSTISCVRLAQLPVPLRNEVFCRVDNLRGALLQAKECVNLMAL